MANKKHAKQTARKKTPAKSSAPSRREKGPARAKPAATKKAAKPAAPPRKQTPPGRQPAKPAKSPLAKLRDGAVDSRKPAADSRKPAEPKPGKAARPVSKRIKTSELNRIRLFLSQKKVALTNHLQTELSELEKPEKRHRTDLEEIASDTHDTDSLCEIMDIEATQISQIDLALAKIDNGTYGVCEDCSGEIPLVRLQALPFATQCIDCRRKAEIQGQISASDTRLA
jgi:RNA polymerase-binding protein DksA